jgi:hypothetical protein
MSNVTINVTKWYHFVLAIGSVVAMLGGAVAYVDSRYTHRDAFELSAEKAVVKLEATENARKNAAEAAYEQSINLQLMIVEGRVEWYAQMRADNRPFTTQQNIKESNYTKQLEFLIGEKNRLMTGAGMPNQ